MIFLHGTWIPASYDENENGWLLLWGEKDFPELELETLPKTRKRAPEKIARHPYAISTKILTESLVGIAEKLTIQPPSFRVGEAVIRLSSIKGVPLPSHQLLLEIEGETVLNDWKVEAIYLPAVAALEILAALPVRLYDYDLPCHIGSDLRFWSFAAKFALRLISAEKFIPTLIQREQKFLAIWQPDLSDPADEKSLEHLVKAMPDVCRSLTSVCLKQSKTSFELPLSPPHPKTLLQDFLKSVVDLWIRRRFDHQKVSRLKKGVSDEAIIRWFDALTRSDVANAVVETTGIERSIESLYDSLRSWIQGGKVVADKFRVCFRLEPPETDEANWTLRYFLQAMDDPSLLVPVDLVWKEKKSTLRYLNREWESPQERLLASLGVASRMFTPIERSLHQAVPESCLISLEEVYQFLSETSLLMQQSGFGVLAPPWWTEKRAHIRSKVRIQSPQDESPAFFSLNRIVHYDLELALGGETITKEELEHLAKLKVPLIRMRGQWVLLRPEEIKAAIEAFEKYRQGGEMSMREALQLSLKESPELGHLAVETVECAGWMQHLFEDLRTQRLRMLKQPKEFVGALRPYQRYGFSWLSFMRQWGLGACLADDMGLGKTIETIALLLHDKKQSDRSKARSGAGPSLLVCPTSVVGNWQREVDKFSPLLQVLIHHGSSRLTDESFVESVQHADLVVTSYGLVHRDLQSLAKVPWKGVILDEAQNIKNPASKTAQSVRKLRSEYKLALTGTPVENRLSELWSIMEFLNPSYLGSQKDFHERFIIPIERYGDEQATSGLKSLISPFILRRLKTDPKIIQDLPEKIEMKVYCNLTREQLTLYEAVVQDMLKSVEEAEGMQRRGLILSGLMKLKQLCDHPALLLHERGSASLAPTKTEIRSGKLQRLTEMLEEVLAEGDKALVFTQFAEMGQILQRYLMETFNKNVLFLHGGVPQKRRQKMVLLFQESNSNDGPPIFVISIRAGGTGLNLTRANHVFHFDRWWNPAVEDQATDRTFRIGQTRNVQVHKFITAGTLEEEVDQLIERKKKLSQSIIGGGEEWLTEISTEELRKLVLFRPEKALATEER